MLSHLKIPNIVDMYHMDKGYYMKKHKHSENNESGHCLYIEQLGYAGHCWTLLDVKCQLISFAFS